MAYIIGLLSPEEESTLAERGWELEDPPRELIPDVPSPGKRLRMVWVDADMLSIMSGPDWDVEAEVHDPMCGMGGMGFCDRCRGPDTEEAES